MACTAHYSRHVTFFNQFITLPEPCLSHLRWIVTLFCPKTIFTFYIDIYTKDAQMHRKCMYKYTLTHSSLRFKIRNINSKFCFNDSLTVTTSYAINSEILCIVCVGAWHDKNIFLIQPDSGDNVQHRYNVPYTTIRWYIHGI